MSSVVKEEPKVVLTSDASGSWGCGAYTSMGGWFQLKFPDSWQNVHKTVKELLPIVLAVALWRHLWKGVTVSCKCDNMAVVAIVNSGRSRMDKAMHLMRCLSFFLARWDVTLVCQHIPGVEKLYACGVRRFMGICVAAGHIPVPADENSLCHFAIMG